MLLRASPALVLVSAGVSGATGAALGLEPLTSAVLGATASCPLLLAVVLLGGAPGLPGRAGKNGMRLEHLRQAMRGAQEALWHWDVRSGQLRLSPRIREIAGIELPAGRLSDEAWQAHVLSADRQRLREQLDRVAAGHPGPLDCEYRIADCSGTVRHLRMRGVARRGRDGRVISVAGSIGDLTKARERESRLRLLERAAESATDGILIADAARGDLPLIFVNAGFERLSGYNREEVLGRNCRFLQSGDRDQDGVRQLREAIAEERPATVLLRNYRKDGSVFWNKLSLAPVCDAEGAVSHFVGIAADVTAELEAEHRRRFLERRLEQAYRVQHFAVLAGSIAHDVGNALVPVISLGELLRARGDLPEEARDMADRICRSGQTVRALVQTVVRRARAAEVERERLDLAAYVKGSVDLIRPGLPANVALSVSAEAPVPVMASAAQIYQVVLNLVTNATRAIGDATGEIAVRVEDLPPDRALLTVCDDGQGMAESMRRQALDPFFTTSAAGGIGLGLPIVKAVVADHGGSLAIESTPGEGTCVRVQLPRTA